MTKLYMIEVGHRDFEFILGIYDSLDAAKEVLTSYKDDYNQHGTPYNVYEVTLNTELGKEYWPTVFSGKTK